MAMYELVGIQPSLAQATPLPGRAAPMPAAGPGAVAAFVGARSREGAHGHGA